MIDPLYFVPVLSLFAAIVAVTLVYESERERNKKPVTDNSPPGPSVAMHEGFSAEAAPSPSDTEESTDSLPYAQEDFPRIKRSRDIPKLKFLRVVVGLAVIDLALSLTRALGKTVILPTFPDGIDLLILGLCGLFVVVDGLTQKTS